MESLKLLCGLIKKPAFRLGLVYVGNSHNVVVVVVVLTVWQTDSPCGLGSTDRLAQQLHPDS